MLIRVCAIPKGADGCDSSKEVQFAVLSCSVLSTLMLQPCCVSGLHQRLEYPDLGDGGRKGAGGFLERGTMAQHPACMGPCVWCRGIKYTACSDHRVNGR